jgi:hypothetical protein
MSDPIRPKPNAAIAGLSILLMAAYRLAPHPWNLAPTGALFLLGGLYMGRSWRGWALPFAAVIVSDAVLYWRWDGSLWRPARLIDYLAFALICLVGRTVSQPGAGPRVIAVAVTPLIFYLVSNFGVWLAGGLYPPTFAGLVDCYVAGLPFVRGSLIGDWLFASAGILAIEGLGGLARSKASTTHRAVRSRQRGEKQQPDGARWSS